PPPLCRFCGASVQAGGPDGAAGRGRAPCPLWPRSRRRGGILRAAPLRVKSLPRRDILLRGRGEASAQGVFREHARGHELLEIIRPAGFRADAAELEPAEGLAIHQRAGDLAIDVKIADEEFAPDALDVGGTAREKSAGQRV